MLQRHAVARPPHTHYRCGKSIRTASRNYGRADQAKGRSLHPARHWQRVCENILLAAILRGTLRSHALQLQFARTAAGEEFRRNLLLAPGSGTTALDHLQQLLGLLKIQLRSQSLRRGTQQPAPQRTR